MQTKLGLSRGDVHTPSVMRVISVSLGWWRLEKSEHVDHTCREATLSQDNGEPRRLHVRWHFVTRNSTRVKENAQENAHFVPEACRRRTKWLTLDR